MQENNKEIYDLLVRKVSSFPALSTIIGEVCSVCQNKESTINDLVKIIERDVGIVVDILRISNSPIYGFTREISNIHQAVALFGMGTIKGFVISSVFRKNIKFNLAPYGISIDSYLDICREFNKFVIDVFKNSPHKDIIFPASFLMISGTLLLSNEAAKLPNKDEFLNKIKSSDCFLDVENEFLGINSIEVTKLLFEQWNFESELVHAIGGINDEVLSEISASLKLALNAISLHRKYEKSQLLACEEFIQKHNLNVDSNAIESCATRFKNAQ